MSSITLPRPAGLGTPSSSWRVAGPMLIVLTLGLLIAYRSTALGMVAIWLRSDTFMHAILVVPVVLWLVWRLRAALAVLTPSPSPGWLLGVAVAAFAWLLGELAQTQALAQVAMTAMLVLAVPAVLGGRIARCLMFPLGFLFFAVPIGEFTMPVLMEWTANFTVFALRLSGIPVYRESQQFIIPSGAWSVVEACSGVRYLIASVMVGTLFAYLNFTRLSLRWAFVGVAILTPVIANWLRAYLIVMIGHLSDNRLATGFDHVIYGWVFFGIVMGVMFAIGHHWQEPIAGTAQAPRTAEASPEASVEASAQPAGPGRFAMVSIVVLLLAIAPHVLLGRLEGHASTAPLAWDRSALGSRWAPAEPVFEWTPAYANPSARFDSGWRADGTKPGSEVALSVFYYRDQGENHRLVSSVNGFVDTSTGTWRQVGSGEQTVDAGGARRVVRSGELVSAAISSRTAQRLRVWQTYWVDDQLTSSDVEAKLRGLVQRLRNGRDDGAAILVSTIDDGSGTADATLAAFLHDNLDAITARLRAVRDAR